MVQRCSAGHGPNLRLEEPMGIRSLYGRTQIHRTFALRSQVCQTCLERMRPGDLVGREETSSWPCALLWQVAEVAVDPLEINQVEAVVSPGCEPSLHLSTLQLVRTASQSFEYLARLEPHFYSRGCVAKAAGTVPATSRKDFAKTKNCIAPVLLLNLLGVPPQNCMLQNVSWRAN